MCFKLAECPCFSFSTLDFFPNGIKKIFFFKNHIAEIDLCIYSLTIDTVCLYPPTDFNNEND